MESINLSIPSMKSQHCIMVVKETFQNMTGVALKSIAPGEAKIELFGTTKASVVESIEKLGYTVVNK